MIILKRRVKASPQSILMAHFPAKPNHKFKFSCIFFFPSQVYRRLKIKPPLAQKLDKYLENFNKSGQICLGNFKLSLEVLGKSKSLLRQFLLQNCHLTESQYQLTLQLYGLRVGDAQDCGSNNDLITDAYHLSKTKASLHFLCKMRDRLTEDMRLSRDRAFMPTRSRPHLSNGEGFLSAVSSEEVYLDVSAHCLLKQVQHQLTFGGNFMTVRVIFIIDLDFNC